MTNINLMSRLACLGATLALLSACGSGAGSTSANTPPTATVTPSTPTPASPTPATSSGNATVSWIPPTQNTDGTPLNDLAGFRVYVGKTSTALTEKVVQIDDPTITRQLIDQLAQGSWYFGVVALNSQGAESPMSAVGSKTI